MKKYLSLLLIVLTLSFAFGSALTSPVLAAGSCTTPTAKYLPLSGKQSFLVVTTTCTADSSAATWPASINITPSGYNIAGRYLTLVTTYNGSTAPTSGYSFVIKDSTGVDVLGAAGASRPGTAGISSQIVPRIDTTNYIAGPRPISGPLYITITGNSVNSGSFTLAYYLMD